MSPMTLVLEKLLKSLLLQSSLQFQLSLGKTIFGKKHNQEKLKYASNKINTAWLSRNKNTKQV